MEKQFIGEVTQQEIDEWKASVKKQFGEGAKVFCYKVDGRICYLRSVDRPTYALAASKVSGSPAQFDQTIIENIWLGGDTTIRDNDRYYFGLKDHVDKMIDKKKGELGEC